MKRLSYIQDARCLKVKETRRQRKLKEKAVDRSVWRKPLEESLDVGQDSLLDADDP